MRAEPEPGGRRGSPRPGPRPDPQPIPRAGETEYPLVRDDVASGFPHAVGMQDLMTAMPDLGWLFSPVGLIVFIVLLGLVMSGFVGRIVHYVDTVLASFETSGATVPVEERRPQRTGGRRS